MNEKVATYWRSDRNNLCPDCFNQKRETIPRVENDGFWGQKGLKKVRAMR